MEGCVSQEGAVGIGGDVDEVETLSEVDPQPFMAARPWLLLVCTGLCGRACVLRALAAPGGQLRACAQGSAWSSTSLGSQHLGVWAVTGRWEGLSGSHAVTVRGILLAPR